MAYFFSTGVECRIAAEGVTNIEINKQRTAEFIIFAAAFFHNIFGIRSFRQYAYYSGNRRYDVSSGHKRFFWENIS